MEDSTWVFRAQDSHMLAPSGSYRSSCSDASQGPSIWEMTYKLFCTQNGRISLCLSKRGKTKLNTGGWFRQEGTRGAFELS